jgi:hypothetical protein
MTVRQRRPFDGILGERITAAKADIRNALVPLRTVAELLLHPDDRQSRDWCASMLEQEVTRIVAILDEL